MVNNIFTIFASNPTKMEEVKKNTRITYDNVPDDVFRIISEEQSKQKIKLKKHVSQSYAISMLIRRANEKLINHQ